MTPLEEAGDNATEKEVLYTLHHDEGSGKDKEEEDCYGELITGVQERIMELNIFTLSIRQPTQIHERITEGRSIMPTLAVRLT